MPNKPIPRGPLNRAIDACRRYYSCYSTRDDLDLFSETCQLIERVAGVNWICLENLISSLFPLYGLKRDATNEEVYAVLRLLGWEVSD